MKLSTFLFFVGLVAVTSELTIPRTFPADGVATIDGDIADWSLSTSACANSLADARLSVGSWNVGVDDACDDFYSFMCESGQCHTKYAYAGFFTKYDCASETLSVLVHTLPQAFKPSVSTGAAYAETENIYFDQTSNSQNVYIKSNDAQSPIATNWVFHASRFFDAGDESVPQYPDDAYFITTNKTGNAFSWVRDVDDQIVGYEMSIQMSHKFVLDPTEFWNVHVILNHDGVGNTKSITTDGSLTTSLTVGQRAYQTFGDAACTITSPSGCTDSDGDGYCSCDSTSDSVCDCNDADSTINPGVIQIVRLCETIDSDCNGMTGYEEGNTIDLDGDGDFACHDDNYKKRDCDDFDANTYTMGLLQSDDVCDGISNNCRDRSDYFNPASGLRTSETDGDADGLMECNGDCDDDDATNQCSGSCCNTTPETTHGNAHTYTPLLNVMDYDTCCTACLVMDGCIAWTWTGIWEVQPNTCYFYTQASIDAYALALYPAEWTWPINENGEHAPLSNTTSAHSECTSGGPVAAMPTICSEDSSTCDDMHWWHVEIDTDNGEQLKRCSTRGCFVLDSASDGWEELPVALSSWDADHDTVGEWGLFEDVVDDEFCTSSEESITVVDFESCKTLCLQDADCVGASVDEDLVCFLCTGTTTHAMDGAQTTFITERRWAPTGTYAHEYQVSNTGIWRGTNYWPWCCMC